MLVPQSCLPLCNPTDCSPWGSFVYGILQARILERVAIPFSRGTSWPRDWTCISCIAGRFFTVWVTVVFLGGSAGEGNGNTHQYSCLKNSMDRGARWTYSPWDCRVRHVLARARAHTHTHTHTHTVRLWPLSWKNCSSLPVHYLYLELEKVVFNLPLNSTMLQDTVIFEYLKTFYLNYNLTFIVIICSQISFYFLEKYTIHNF